jgi:phosphate transport system substrate-binding protein
VTQPGDAACDVRFRAALTAPDDTVIARDGVVVVVNPQNTVSRLDILQVRGILAGRITDWSQVGGRSGSIVVAVPDDTSDEAAVVSAKVMFGQPFGSHVVRTLAPSEIVRAVSSPSGVRSMGVVPFSAAIPAKVVALGRAPPASPLSIADDRYPMSVRIVAESDFRYPSRGAADLLAFARSPAANDLFVRSALVSKNGI